MSKRDAHLLEGTALAVFLVLIFGSFGASLLDGIFVRGGQSAAVEVAVMVDLTNQNRTQNDLPGLTISPVLTRAAQAKANDEAANGYFAHTSPAGLDSWYWFKQAGYNFTYAGENLAVDFSDSAAVVSAWMNSPEHRANILDGHYTEIGIATASGMFQGHPTIFVVQEFGDPASPAIAAASITQETQPAEPTQIAEATTQQAAPPPQVLGSTNNATKPATHVSVSKPSAAATLANAPTSNVLPIVADTQPITLPISSATALATSPVHYASGLDFYIASPETALRYVYYGITLLVLLSLLLTTGFEFRRHHLRHMAVAGALLIAMCGLFFIANTMVFGHPAIAQAVPVSTSAKL